MSNWSHVAGIFRIDSFRLQFITGNEEDAIDFDELFGTEWHPYDDDWDESKMVMSDNAMPTGSEGSLYKCIWENPNPSHMAAYAVSVFGDLRNHDGFSGGEEDEIYKWMHYICTHAPIREAIVEVKNEWNNNTTVLRYLASEDKIIYETYDNY